MVRWLAYSLVGWLVSWLVGWLVRWFVGWLADWLACWLSSWMASLLALLAQIAWLRFNGFLGSLAGLLTGWLVYCLVGLIAWLAGFFTSSLALITDLTNMRTCLLFAYSSRLFDFEILPDPNSFDFQFTGKSFVKLKLSMIFLEASPRGCFWI